MNEGTGSSSKAQLVAALNAMLTTHVGKRVNGNVASGKTQRTHSEVLRTCFNNLWDLNYRITNPNKLETKHVTALCRHWYESGIAPKTMQSRLSTLRIMSRWIEKPNLVKSLTDYLPDVPKAELRAKTAAEKSKSWAEHDIDLVQKFYQADMLDRRFGVMLKMELAFGLRRDEVLQFKPHKSDEGTKIRIYEAKGGRLRIVDIVSEGQRYVLNLAKAICSSKLQPLGWLQNKDGNPRTLEQNERRYNDLMQRIGITKYDAGVTGHGLRAQFAENLALHSKLIPATLGGTRGQMSKDDVDLKRAQVSEQLGHSRISVTSAYYGSFGRNVTPDEVNRCRDNIESGLKNCHAGVTVPVPEERKADCLAIIAELDNLGVELSLRQAHMVWSINSRNRHASDWVKPELGIAEAIEVVALNLVKQN
jgi:integrase